MAWQQAINWQRSTSCAAVQLYTCIITWFSQRNGTQALVRSTSLCQPGSALTLFCSAYHLRQHVHAPWTSWALCESIINTKSQRSPDTLTCTFWMTLTAFLASRQNTGSRLQNRTCSMLAPIHDHPRIKFQFMIRPATQTHSSQRNRSVSLEPNIQSGGKSNVHFMHPKYWQMNDPLKVKCRRTQTSPYQTCPRLCNT